MEKYVTLFLPGVLTLLLVRLASAPVRAAWRVMLHSAGGLVCLGLLDTISGLTGVVFPINAVTVLTAGFGGLPGVSLMALLELL